MFKKNTFFPLLLILISSFAFSQSKKLWIEIADNAYAKKDYATAAVYYAKVLDDTTVLKDFVLPYETQLVNLKMKSLFKVPELKVTKRKDSTNTVKETVINSSKYDFIMYRLAQSYRLNFDYKHAVPQYKKCVERKVYPDAPYYYGLSLMNLKKYQDALKTFDEYTLGGVGTDSLLKLAVKKQQSCFFCTGYFGRQKINKGKINGYLSF